MRAFVIPSLVLGLSGCLGGNSRPSVMPKLSELPGDPSRRDAILDSSNATPGPEFHRAKPTGRAAKVETAAATVAAIIGDMFSSTKNVTIGHLTMIEETSIVHGSLAPATPRPRPAPTSAPSEAPVPGVSNADLIPWIRLK